MVNGLAADAIFDNKPLIVSKSYPVPCVPVKLLTFKRYRPPPAHTFVPFTVNVPTLLPLGDSVAPLPINTTPLPPTTVPAPANVAPLVTNKPCCNHAVPPACTLNVAALLPFPTTNTLPLLMAVLNAVKMPLLSAKLPPVVTFKFVVSNCPPLSASVPPLTSTLLIALPVPVNAHVPAPSLFNAPLPVKVPAKLLETSP